TFADEAAEIVHAAVFEELVTHGRDAALDVGLAALGPETFFDGDGADGDGVELGVGRVIEMENALITPRELRRVDAACECEGEFWIAKVRRRCRGRRCRKKFPPREIVWRFHG